MEKIKITKIICGDYTAKNTKSLLSQCEKIRSDYDGMLHNGIIHYIQNKMPNLTLKAAITRVLDKCPSIWAEDLPEQIQAGKEPKITKIIKKEFKILNQMLLIPIQGDDIIEIIKLAKDFLNKGKIN